MLKSLITYSVISLVLGAGIWLMVWHHHFWLLLLGVIVYLFLFIRYGCLSSE